MWHAEVFGSVRTFAIGLENTWKRHSDTSSMGMGDLPISAVVAIKYAIGLDEQHICYI